MSNYIPNEANVFDDQNQVWMKAEIETLSTAKNNIFEKHLKNKQNCYYTYKCKVLKQQEQSTI